MKAIRKVIWIGHLWITIPVILLLLSLPLTFLLCTLFLLKEEQFWVIFTMPAFFFLSYKLATFYWAYMITKWRLYAFGKIPVRNWIALYEAAIMGKLIWRNNTKWNNKEIRTAIEDEQIGHIQDTIFDLHQTARQMAFLTTPYTIYYPARKIEIIGELIGIALLFSAPFILTGIGDLRIYLGVPCVLFGLFQLKNFYYLPYLFLSDIPILTINEIGIHLFTASKEEVVYWHQIEGIANFNINTRLIFFDMQQSDKRRVLNLSKVHIDSTYQLLLELDLSWKRSVQCN